MTFRTRFAPSPTGPLHLGHAYSAILAHDMAMAHGGAFLLRIEDIDRSRSRPEWEEQIFDDLRWLGLTWEEPVLRQSDRQPAYRAALERLWSDELLFACACNRRDILDALSAPQEGAPSYGPDGIIYPGTCREEKSRGQRALPDDMALRLDMRAAIGTGGLFDHRIDGTKGTFLAHFEETGHGPDGQCGRIEFDVHTLPETVGDVVLARRDMGTSYHLSVVLDDAYQGITHVVRGEDLFDATRIHVVLQTILGLPTPVYHHHRLIRDDSGKRLAKRDDARAIARYRDDGASPADIRRMVGLEV